MSPKLHPAPVQWEGVGILLCDVTQASGPKAQTLGLGFLNVPPAALVGPLMASEQVVLHPEGLGFVAVQENLGGFPGDGRTRQNGFSHNALALCSSFSPLVARQVLFRTKHNCVVSSYRQTVRLTGDTF